MPLTLTQLAAFDPRISLAYVGDWKACVFLLQADKQAVDDLLLPGPLKPGPQYVTPLDKHPVVFMIGNQSNVRPEFADPELAFLTMNYREVIAAVPYVQWEDAASGCQSFVCSRVLYLDETLPTMLGWLCGYPKTVGQIRSTSSKWDIKSLDDDPLLKCNVKVDPEKPLCHPSAFPNFGALRDIFQQTHVGRLVDLPGDAFDMYIYAKLDLRLDQAKMRPITLKGNLTSDFCPAVATNFSLTGIDIEALGAFYLETSWRLPPPTQEPH